VKIHQTINGSFQDSILERLHHHIVINMFSNEILDTRHAQILSCLGLRVSAWFIIQPIFSTFQLSSPIFSTTLWMWLGLTHPSITSLPQCVCTHPIDPMGIHFLCCAHGNECMGTHDAIHNTFVIIVWDVGLYIGQEQLHALPLARLDSFCWWIKIVFTKDAIRTVIDIVITNPLHVDLPFQFCTTQGFVISNTTQTKERSYHNQFPTNQFFPLTIELI